MSFSFMVESLSFTRRQWRALAFTVAISGLVAEILAIVFYGILPEQGTWAGYPESLPGICEQFCESSHMCHLTMAERPPIVQPVNAWTGIIFLICGLWPIANRVDLSTIAFFCGNAYLGSGTFMFHASLAEVWGDTDVAGVFAALAATACHCLHANFDVPWRWMILPIVAVTFCNTFFYPEMKSIGLVLEMQMYPFQAIMVLGTLRLVVARIQQIRKHSNDPKKTAEQRPCIQIIRVLFFASLPAILFLSAWSIWLMENARVFCNPSGIIQGHSAWHIFSGVSLLMNWSFCDQNHLADIRAAGEDLDQTDRTDEFNEDDFEEEQSDPELGLRTAHELSPIEHDDTRDVSV